MMTQQQTQTMQRQTVTLVDPARLGLDRYEGQVELTRTVRNIRQGIDSDWLIGEVKVDGQIIEVEREADDDGGEWVR